MGKVACATAMGLGTAIGGWKIIKTVGGNIMKIRPANGAAADLSSALTIFVAHHYTSHYLRHTLYHHQFWCRCFLTELKVLNGTLHNV